MYLISLLLLCELVPLRYEPETANVAVMDGSSPRIYLNIDAAPRISDYTWEKDGERITSNGRVSLTVNSISFNPVSRSDSGEYTVIATDSKGTGSATITLDVYCEFNNIICLFFKICMQLLKHIGTCV